MKGYLHTFLDLQQEPPGVVQRALNAVDGDCHGMATTFTGRGCSNYSCYVTITLCCHDTEWGLNQLQQPGNTGQGHGSGPV